MYFQDDNESKLLHKCGYLLLEAMFSVIYQHWEKTAQAEDRDLPDPV